MTNLISDLRVSFYANNPNIIDHFRMFAPKCAACGKGITPVEVGSTIFEWFTFRVPTN